MTCRTRTFWLCTTCNRCRRYTSLHALFGRFWCAHCQAVTCFKPVGAMPQMARYAKTLLVQEDEA